MLARLRIKVRLACGIVTRWPRGEPTLGSGRGALRMASAGAYPGHAARAIRHSIDRAASPSPPSMRTTRVSTATRR